MSHSTPAPDQAVPKTLDRAEFGREWEEWHRQREAGLVNPAGFLAITGLYRLSEQPTTPDGAPGSWTRTDDVVRVDLAGEATTVELDGTPLGEQHEFEPIAERGGVTVTFAGGAIEVAKRGGIDVLRPRSSDAAFLSEYSGTPTYLPNPRWRVEGQFVPFDEPRAITVDAALEGIQHVYESPGEVEFTLRGETFRLTAFPGFGDGSLLLLFTDATSGLTTYSAVRSLIVPAPDDEGRTVVDFNRTSNLPCAYTDFATCPLPPEGNRLPIGIEAGEKTPYERVHGVARGSHLVLPGADQTDAPEADTTAAGAPRAEAEATA